MSDHRLTVTAVQLRLSAAQLYGDLMQERAEAAEARIAELERQLRQWESGNWESERSQNIRHHRDSLRRRVGELAKERDVALRIILSTDNERAETAEARVAELEAALERIAYGANSKHSREQLKAIARAALSPPKDKP